MFYGFLQDDDIAIYQNRQYMSNYHSFSGIKYLERVKKEHNKYMTNNQNIIKLYLNKLNVVYT